MSCALTARHVGERTRTVSSVLSATTCVASSKLLRPVYAAHNPMHRKSREHTQAAAARAMLLCAADARLENLAFWMTDVILRLWPGHT